MKKEILRGVTDPFVLVMENVIEDVKKERQRQNEKWGVQNRSLIEWNAILTEEVGEAAKEAVDHHFATDADLVNPYTQRDRLERYRAEMVQVAAVAIQAIENIDRNAAEKALNFAINYDQKVNSAIVGMVKAEYYRHISGVEGYFVERRVGRDGIHLIIIATDKGDFFAPAGEFRLLGKGELMFKTPK